jgi:hypothetical protein
MDESKEQLEMVEWMQDNLFHFSAKTVNSNATSAGVRVGKDEALNLPYVSVRTLLHEGREIGLDYLGGAVNAFKFKRLRQFLGEAGGEAEPDAPRQEFRQSYQQATAAHIEQGTHYVGPRLRQLLIPKGDGYVSLTPLGAAGLCETIRGVSNKRQEDRKAEAKESGIGRDRRVRQFSVGGSNPQNVGGRVREMRPFVFANFPRRWESERRAFAIYHKGFWPFLPKRLVERYADWLKIQKGPHPELLVTMRLKEEEEKHIRLLVKSVEAQAESAATLLDKHRDVLPASPETKPDTLSPCSLEQGWLQPTLRSPAWRAAMAQWLVEKLANFRLGHTSDGHPIRMLLTPEDRHRLTRMLEEV